MEAAFSADFSSVRVHTDSAADDAASTLNAHALTAGTDILFRSGAYNPGTQSGDRLLAHELAHVVQQRDGVAHAAIDGGPSDPLERAADAAADSVARTVWSSRAVASAPQGSGPGVRRPGAAVALQRAACEYEASEKAKAAAGGGLLAPAVTLLATIGSGYNAAGNSVVVADFAPGSAVVRGSAAAELRGSWKGILERSTQSYALLGFTDCVSGERADPRLRADRSHAVAALLPNTARRASVIGAAPAGDFLLPANATPQDRATNRSVLIRLPFEELRQAGEVDEYSAGAVGFWRSNPTATVDQLIDVVAKEAATHLDRNGVYKPDVVKKTIKDPTALAFFEAHSWTITVDEQKMTVHAGQAGVTPASKMSKLNIEAVAELASAIYHEFRHAEESFLSARLIAEEAKGTISPRDLARELDIPVDVADVAVAASGTVLPDMLKAQARGWRTFEHGGRYLKYKQWNETLRAATAIFNTGAKWEELQKKAPGQIRVSWENFLHPLIDKVFRRNYSPEADALLREIKAGPHHDAVDADVERALTETSFKLFNFLAKERGGKDLATPDAIAKMDPIEAKLARLAELSWLLCRRFWNFSGVDR
jgi:hypothetical protein